MKLFIFYNDYQNVYPKWNYTHRINYTNIYSLQSEEFRGLLI